MPNLQPPMDCLHKCWEQYPTSKARYVIEFAAYVDPRIGPRPFVCPHTCRSIASRMFHLGLIPRPSCFAESAYVWSKLIGQLPSNDMAPSESSLPTFRQESRPPEAKSPGDVRFHQAESMHNINITKQTPQTPLVTMVDNPAPVLTTATDQQAQRLETSIKEFASEKKQNAFVSEIDVIGGPGKAFAIIFLTQ